MIISMAVKFSCKNVASLSLFSLFWILFFLSLLSQTMMSHKRAGERKWASLFLNTTSTCSRTMSYLTAIIIWWKWRKQKCGSFTWTRTFLGAKKKEKKGKHRKGKADRFKRQMAMTKVKKVTQILWVKMEIF